MKVGTRSILFGAHLWFWHPWVIALAWYQLYGFRRVTCPSSKVTTSLFDWRLWLCFLVHDWGYWGCSEMDGPEGELHPEFGAKILQRVLSPGDITGRRVAGRWWQYEENRWYDFVFYHSRFLAKRYNHVPSLLCAADKLAIALEPSWLYLPRVIVTGEIKEYMRLADSRNLSGDPTGKYVSMNLATGSRRAWHASVRDYTRRWAFAHRDGKADNWTPITRAGKVIGGTPDQ